ncbi:hypothetical protein [Actinomadura hibisca]|uniref:hypothetical protein n=1 Tax=Actinomadura hibisca TaxID=68565 RepID=UPI000834DECF|nr:hypothetical protein [Actinomadura hibisca]
MTRRSRHLPAALTGLGLGLLALGPALAPGFVLSYDMVFVPEPVFNALTFGLTGTVPRHVPSDAFVAALSLVLPGGWAQKAILLAIFVMACVSAASLVPSERLLPRLAAGVCYAWNPFVAERLLLGQWALLLGYAALPWVVAAAVSAGEPGGGKRLVRALIPAAIGGFAALAVSGLAALAAALAGAGRRRATPRVVAAGVALSLPWLAPGLLRSAGIPGDVSGVDAFAARADTPFGTLGSLLALGGVWNGEAVPAGYGTPVLAVAWLIVVLVALVAYAKYCRTPWAHGAAVAAAVGFVVAALGAVASPMLESAIRLWSCLALLRDGQQFVAPLAVVVAVGLGVAADRACEARLPVAALGAALVPVLVLPSLAMGGAGRLRAVDYPDDWARAKQIIEADRAAGDVLLLPWAYHRSYPWNHGRRVLDPLPRYLDRRVIANDAVTVGVPGRAVTVAAEDPRARRLDPLIKASGPLTGDLRGAGVGYVLVDEPETASAWSARLPGVREVLRGPDVVLYRVPGAVPVAERTVPVPPVVLAWLVAGLVVFWSFLAPGTNLGTPHPLRPLSRRTR